MATLFEIKLKSVLVIENGKIEEDAEGVNAVSINLIYPREGVPSVSSVRTIELLDREEKNFEQADIRKRFLMKELVKGGAILEAEVTAIEKVSKFEKFIHKMFKVGAVAATGTLGVGAVVTGLTKTATESFFDSIEPSDQINSIGKGFMPLNEQTPEGDFVINLAVPKELKLHQTSRNEDGELVKTILTLKKGFVNAKVVVDLKIIEN